MALASRKLTSKIYEVQAHSQKVTCLDLGQTGRVLVTGGQDRNVNLWAFGNDKCFMSLTGHNGQIDCVKFAYNDDYVYSSDENGIIKRWDLNAQPECSTFYGHMKSVRTLDFHPYGEYVVSGSNDTTVRLWDVRNNNNCIKKYRGHIANVNSVKFSPDGSWIASAGTEGSVIIWDIRMSKQIIEFLEHASPVTCIQFHPFEFLLAAGRNDGTVDLYDLESRQLISRSGSKSPFNGHTVKCVTFSETGKCLFVGTAAGISVIGWEPDRNYDHIDSSWSLLGDMKVINQKLFCGSFENKSVDIHAIHLNQVIPYYNPSNVQFNQNQSSRKSFSRGNQKLRLSIGNNTSSSNNNNIITTISTPPSTIDNLNNEINIQQNSDGGMSSPNLSIEMIDETEEHPQLSNGFPFNNNNNNNNTNKYNKSQQNTTSTTTTTAGNTNVTTTNLYESLPSIDNYKYDNYVLGDGPSSLKLSNESSSSSSMMVPQTITTDISIDTYTSDLDYYPMRSSPSLFNNVSDPEREDFPVNNAQPPDYAPKMDQHLNKTVLSKYKINSQLQQRKQQSQSINSNNIHINQSLSNNNNSNNNNNNINNMKSFAQQTRKFSNLSTSISTIDLHKLSDETMNNGKKHLISSRTSSPVRNYIGSNKLKKNDTTTMTTLNSTTQQLNKENNIRNNRKINVQILLPPNKPPPPRSKTSLDLRATSVSQPQQQQQHQQQQILQQQQQQQHQSQSYSHTQTTSSTYLQSTSIATPTSPFAQRSSSNYSNNNNNNNTSQYQSTSADESTEMRILTSYHERVSQELSNRHATLQLIRNSTRANDIVGALKQSIKINDRSILVDLLGAILEKTGSWNLDMCLFLLPEIYDLLQSEHKFHCTRGCDTLRVILSNFLPVIRENTGPWGIPISLGVDISGEERHKKCMDCRQWLLRIKNLPENQYMGSNLMQLQNLIVDL